MERQRDELDRRLRSAEKDFRELEQELTAAQVAWERTLAGMSPLDWTITHGLTAHYELDGDATDATGKSEGGKFQGGEGTFRLNASIKPTASGSCGAGATG